MSKDMIEGLYEDYLKTTKDPQAAAMLCIAAGLFQVVKSTNALSADSLGHEICMGIRHGLFGAGAGDSQGITDVADAIADAIRARDEVTE